jgi:hypothetical protein
MALFTVRNAHGEFLGTYHARTPAAAIQAHRDGVAVARSVFRAHETPSYCGETASIEPIMPPLTLAQRRAQKGA